MALRDSQQHTNAAPRDDPDTSALTALDAPYSSPKELY
jgi:hypothetical protein